MRTSKAVERMETERLVVKAVVADVFRAHDPKGLLAQGCPADEYDAEVDALSTIITSSHTEQEIWIAVCNVLHWYFGDSTEPVLYWRKYREMANDIYARLHPIERKETIQ